MPVSLAAQSDLAPLAASFARHQQAGRLSERTIESYGEAIARLDAYLAEQGMPRVVAALTREHVEAFIRHLLDTSRPATAANRYAGLRAFFKWLVEEGELKASPMARMHPPRVEPPRPIPPTREELGKVLHSLDRDRSFRGVRDQAILRVFVATGVRLSELAGLRWAPDDPRAHDVDLDARYIRVMGKGRRERLVRLSTEAVKALDRYERVRGRHKDADVPWYWLGRKGKLGVSAIEHMVNDRAAAVGVRWHAHLLRHSFIHYSLSNGIDAVDVMAAVGHRDLSMITRVYGAALAQDRAMDAMGRRQWDRDL